MSVRNAAGAEVGITVPSANFGGISTFGQLDKDKPFQIALDLNAYVTLPPGQYRLVVQYHDEEQISFMADLSSLVIFESDPIDLHVSE
jgi:hypothetical protein